MVLLLFIDSQHVRRGGQDRIFTVLGGLILQGHKFNLCRYVTRAPVDNQFFLSNPVPEAASPQSDSRCR